MHNGKSTVTRKSVKALAAALQAQGLDDLAADVTFGPIAVASHMSSIAKTDSTVEAEHSTDIDEDCIEDVLDESDNNDDEDSVDESDEDSFDEILDEDSEDEDADFNSTARSNHISTVILDPDRTYSRQELQTLRTVANTCIARKHLVPNAKALLQSLDAYESQH